MFGRYFVFAIGVLALMAGLVLSAIWYQDASMSPAARALPPQPLLTAVLTTTRDLPAGTLVRLEDMGWREVAAPQVTAASLLRGQFAETELAGAIVRRALQRGEQILGADLVKPGERDFLIVALAPGNRAVSINVDAAQVTSGLIQPGDRVDVLLTQTFSTQGADQSGKAVGETVLQNLRVLALDQTFNRTPHSAEVRGSGDMRTITNPNEVRLPKTVTLEVTERQAEALMVAEQLGKILLALRGRQSDTTAPPAPVVPTWAADVSPALARTRPAEAVAPIIPPATAPPPATETPETRIEVIRGSRIERLCLSRTGLVPCP